MKNERGQSEQEQLLGQEFTQRLERLVDVNRNYRYPSNNEPIWVYDKKRRLLRSAISSTIGDLANLGMGQIVNDILNGKLRRGIKEDHQYKFTKDEREKYLEFELSRLGVFARMARVSNGDLDHQRLAARCCFNTYLTIRDMGCEDRAKDVLENVKNFPL